MTTYQIGSTIYLNTTTKCYLRVITINTKPPGILGQYVTTLSNKLYNKLSPFKDFNSCNSCSKTCFNAIKNPTTNELYCFNELTEFTNFVIDNGYTIDYELSKLMSANDRVNTNKDIIYYITSP